MWGKISYISALVYFATFSSFLIVLLRISFFICHLLYVSNTNADGLFAFKCGAFVVVCAMKKFVSFLFLIQIISS